MTLRTRLARAIDPARWAQIEAMPITDPARQVLVVAEMMRVDAVLAVFASPSDADVERVARSLREAEAAADGQRRGRDLSVSLDVARAAIRALVQAP